MKRLLFIIMSLGILFACKNEELPDADPVAVIDDKVTLNVHAKSLSSAGILNPLLSNSILLYLSEEDRMFSDNLYYQATTNTAGTATFSDVLIGDYIYLESLTQGGDREWIDFEIGNMVIKNVEIIHSL